MLTTRTPEGGATDMHVYMLQQLAADRVAELRADARRARHQRVLLASKADRAACRAGPVNLAAALRHHARDPARPRITPRDPPRMNRTLRENAGALAVKQKGPAWKRYWDMVKEYR